MINTTIEKNEILATGVKFFVMDAKKEVARAFLYVMHNDLHDRPFGFMEDVFVDETYRNHGLGTSLVNELIKEAKRRCCYKLIATSRHSRPKVHDLYKRLGFTNHGVEFRMDML